MPLSVLLLSGSICKTCEENFSQKLLSRFFAVGPLYALQFDKILVIANSDIEASTRIAQYYRAKRDVLAGNVLALPLGKTLNDTISQADYKKLLAQPIRLKLSEPNFAGKIAPDYFFDSARFIRKLPNKPILERL